MSKHYLAREFGLYFNSGQWSGKVQQSPTYAAQPSSFSDNLSMDLISPPSLEWETSGERDTTCLDKVSAGVGAQSHSSSHRSLWMLPTRTGWELCFPGKGALQGQGTNALKLSGIRTLRKSEHSG